MKEETRQGEWNKVDVPNSVTYLNRASVSEWWVVRCRSKNRHQKDMCFKEIGLHAQKLFTIQGSIVNIIGGHQCDLLMAHPSGF